MTEPWPPAAPPPPTRRRGSLVGGVLVVVLVLALALGAVLAVQAVRDDGDPTGSGPNPTAAPPAPSGPLPRTDPRLAKYYGQRLHWSACGAN